MPHHGIANGDECTTWSIGFRAPLMSDLVMRMAELIGEQLPALRYTDGSIRAAEHGEISNEAIAAFQQHWQKATSLSKTQFTELLGQWLTESGGATRDSQISYVEQPDAGRDSILQVGKAPFSRFARVKHNDEQSSLFVDGSHFACSSSLALTLCSAVSIVELNYSQADSSDKKTIDAIIDMGCLTIE